MKTRTEKIQPPGSGCIFLCSKSCHKNNSTRKKGFVDSCRIMIPAREKNKCVFRKEEEKDRVYKNITSCDIVDTSTSGASKFQGGEALNTGAYAVNM